MTPAAKPLAGLLIAFWAGAACAQTPEESWGCASAFYSQPTDEYDHGVLGDALEYKRLTMTFFADARRQEIVERTIVLPEGQVFEDLAPRCWDFDGDGAPDQVTVISDAREGARVAIFIRGEIAYRTPPIGQGYRWLAPVGIADMDGDGAPEVAWVETPHLRGILRVWTVRDGTFAGTAALPGFSNHRIGDAFITGGVRDCGEGPELVLPDFGWNRLMAVRLSDGALTATPLAGAADRTAADLALGCDR